MKILQLLCCCLVVVLSHAQTNVGLVAYYTLDTDLTDFLGNNASNGIANGAPTLGVCGAESNAMFLNGNNDFVRFIDDQVTGEFDTEDFTLSFYFKSNGGTQTQYLLTKLGPDCILGNNFTILFDPVNNLVNATLSDVDGQFATIKYRILNDACWQHLTFIRQRNKIQLYINGEFAAESGSDARVDIENTGALILGGVEQECKDQTLQLFKGIIDEFRLYNRALDEDEIAGLYAQPDQVVTRDTIIFLGSSVQAELSKTCSQEIRWTLGKGNEMTSISTAANPLITPPAAGTFVYDVALTDNLVRDNNTRCIARDSLIIRVIDPTDLDCNQIFLPKAFTPNGDNLNDTYGISNPIAIQQLISFEIFDRWGNRVFFTDNPQEQWDGFYRGTEVNPGVMVYRIQYVCEGEEELKVGSFTILK